MLLQSLKDFTKVSEMFSFIYTCHENVINIHLLACFGLTSTATTFFSVIWSTEQKLGTGTVPYS